MRPQKSMYTVRGSQVLKKLKLMIWKEFVGSTFQWGFSHFKKNDHYIPYYLSQFSKLQKDYIRYSTSLRTYVEIHTIKTGPWWKWLVFPFYPVGLVLLLLLEAILSAVMTTQVITSILSRSTSCSSSDMTTSVKQ